ncbi:uncharacterized protein CANTADRAFT_26965 [Suhomyces tanzawaensis NRRL Y-17324]|uniref:Uncharacterized protein n=1 Tax=Suhomyces tanzawaensis NRRL Y-17324 TaxID=984487 RepID=A0A1E4SEU5_9ASCO|nr:uncharacterized protein CANTADRAFT_26965 [Suhomyces tanzawaensis NRRL Y-17324]ODV78000.1 hypothetical protein CANTADRAFT_26965 [Suhomyces tanzawaensis NRRL Y-17324]
MARRIRAILIGGIPKCLQGSEVWTFVGLLPLFILAIPVFQLALPLASHQDRRRKNCRFGT